MCKIILFTFLLLNANASKSQLWTWVNGNNYFSNINDKKPIRGLKGIVNPSNYPGARANSVVSMDLNGNAWLYGGVAFQTYNLTLPITDIYNDIWKYEKNSNIWVWINGDSSYSKNCSGSQIPKIEYPEPYSPGARTYAHSWTDSVGNFWIYGGLGNSVYSQFGLLGDLWKYNISTNMWSYRKGTSIPNSLGNYGTAGVSNASNAPEATCNGSSAINNSGKFFMFGGSGWNSSSTSNPSDYFGNLWMYDTLTNYWTFLSGFKDLRNKVGIYSNTNNPNLQKPGCRIGASIWFDNNSKLYLYGGFGYGYKNSNVTLGELGDLWTFDISTNIWQCLNSDSNTVSFKGNYGIKNTPSNTSKPSARDGSLTWKDTNGDFWLLGGYGNYPNSVSDGFLNDLWRYSQISKNWTWMGGDSIADQYGIYNVKGIQNPLNQLGGRTSTKLSPRQNYSKEIFVYGGTGYSSAGDFYVLGDLWKLSLTTYLPLNLLSFTSEIVDNSIKLKWTITNQADIMEFVLERGNNSSDFIKIGSVDAIQNIKDLDYFFTDKNIENDLLLYRIKIIEKNGNYSYSKVLKIKNSNKIKINCYPNPVKETLFIDVNNTKNKNCIIQITDMMGNIVKQGSYILLEKNNHITIDVKQLPKGSYTLSGIENNNIKFIKQ